MSSVPATAKQVSFIQSLASERGVSSVDYANLTISSASDLIGKFLSMPKAGSRPVVTSVGMYQTAEGDIYRVKQSRESGNLYAMRLSSHGGFEYESGAMRKLSSADRMTLEAATAYGVATGLCCVCGIMLTDPASVARGIGPICAKRF